MGEKLSSEEDASLEETLGASGPVFQPEAGGKPEDFKEDCQFVRKIIEANKKTVKALMEHPVFDEEVPQGQDRGEMKANIQLCFRHLMKANIQLCYRDLEDARMRLKKAIQACDGGVSLYPK